MTASTGAALLQKQLEAALVALSQGETSALEAAALAGLLQRIDSAPSIALPTVPAAQLTAAALDAAEFVINCDPHHDEAEAWDALSTLDETCAAATWLQLPHLVHAAVEDAVGFVRAFPETWHPHANAATELLRTQPPLPSDPARLLWAAVEASRWATLEPDAEGEAPLGLKERLGIPLVIDLAPYLAVAKRQAAGPVVGLDDLPAKQLARGQGWELYLALDEQDQPKLVLLGDIEVECRRDGARVELVQDPDEGRSTPAGPGSWEIRLDDRTIRLNLDISS